MHYPSVTDVSTVVAFAVGNMYYRSILFNCWWKKFLWDKFAVSIQAKISSTHKFPANLSLLHEFVCIMAE